MKVRLMLGCVGVLLLSPALAQVPVAELARPPPDARHYVIQSTGGKHGDSWSWVAADLALIEGDPATRIGDLRQTRLVVLDGKLLDADALREAAGYSGRPK